MLKIKTSPPCIRSDSASNRKKPVLQSVVVMLIILVAVLPSACAADPVWTYSSAGTTISSISVSSDGSAIAVGADKIWIFSRSGVLLAKEPFGELVMMTPDGKHLISAYSSTLYFFDRNVAPDRTNFSCQKKWEYNLPASVRSIDISDDGTTIVASSQGSGTYIFSSSGKLTGSKGRYSALVRVASYGGKILGVSTTGLFEYSKTGDITNYNDISIGSEPDVMEITGSGNTVVYNDNQRIVSVNALNGSQQWSTLATGDVTSLAMTDGGSKIVVGTDNGHVDLFDSKGNLSWSYSANPENKQGAMVKGVALSNNGKIAVAGETYNGKIVALDSAGRKIWTNQTKDHISHVAMSSDGSLVVVTREETVYAFSPSAASSPVTQTTLPASGTPHPPSVTNASGQTSTQKPEISVTPPRTITSVPTTYSVIRTPTQSPVSEFIPLSALLIALLVLRRH